MLTSAVIIRAPGTIELGTLQLDDPGPDDLVVQTTHSGISTGTERLLWSGTMPNFPGMGYPLVPGYESTGSCRGCAPRGEMRRPRWASRVSSCPGARCFGDGARAVRRGGGASRGAAGSTGPCRSTRRSVNAACLLALAATAYHVTAQRGRRCQPDLIVGHGALGRLLARIAVASRRRTGGVGNQSGHAHRRGRKATTIITPDSRSRGAITVAFAMRSGDASPSWMV